MQTRILVKVVKMSFDCVDLPTTNNKHFSFIIRKGNVLGWGFSQLKSHPLAAKWNYKFQYLHSELDAIRKFPFKPLDFEDCCLINVRVNRKGEIQNSRPCKTCTSLLATFNFKEIWFTNSDGNFERF